MRPDTGAFFLKQNSCLHLSISKSICMKNVYFILAVIIVFAQSCTIQKRQHLPGYHIEWNTKDSHSEVQREKKPEQVLDIAEHDVALAAEVAAQPLEQEMQTMNADAELAAPRDLEEEAAPVNGNSTAKNHSEKLAKQRFTFPSIIHSPVKLLFGGIKPEDKPRTDGISIAAMVCGILSFFVPVLGLVLAILAIIFGGVGLGRTNRNPELKGRGMAITGLVLGIVGMLFVILVLTILSLSFGFAI
jgi:hypothetical protein